MVTSKSCFIVSAVLRTTASSSPACGLLLCVAACLICGCSAESSSEEPTRFNTRTLSSARGEQTETPHHSVGHLINFDPSPFIEDSRTKAMEDTLRVEPVSPADEPRWRDWLAPELRKYGPEFFEPYFRIYPCHVLEINGRPSAGTLWPMGVVVAEPRSKPAGAAFFAAYTLHHEVSTWLVLGHDFEWPRWLAVNPADFEYLRNEDEAAQRGWGGSKIADEALLERGFVTQYAQVFRDNDFAEICANLFMGRSEFWAAVDRHELIRKKTQLAIDFFASLDSRFSESYFRSLLPAQH